MTMTDRLRQLADDLDNESVVDEMPSATNVLDGIEQLRPFIPNGSIELSLKWEPFKKIVLVVRV